LRLAYPIYGKNTFRPSGDPATDPPEQPSLSTRIELARFRIDTPDDMRAYDRLLGRSPTKEATYWDRIRFLQPKSPRARKRAEARQAEKVGKLPIEIAPQPSHQRSR
jgi:hypothetical protein